MDISFFRGKRVLVTGHTGFKGAWMCRMLIDAGANLTGYALEAPTTPSLYKICCMNMQMNSIKGDIRDLNKLKRIFAEVRPEIVIHMAAQPIVRDSYNMPVYTYDVNVMGTVNILECIRLSDFVRSFINVTTDKVYLNKEWIWGYRENEELNGSDPYSNSKSCSELVTSSYKQSFFKKRNIAITTVRAGNVIGGGDFANERIIPDCIRAAHDKKEIIVRNPNSVRPYQHVLEPVAVYLMIAQRQYEDNSLAGNYNVGPDEGDCYTTGQLVTMFCKKWNAATNMSMTWKNVYHGAGEPHEAKFLKLDSSKLKSTFDWKPRWNLEKAMEKVIDWTKIYFEGGDIEQCMRCQIEEFLSL